MARLLAVDDEPQILTALGRCLSRADHEVGVANTGEDALVMVASWVPDLVVLDLKLPDLDGIEVVRRLRSWTDIPILLLSGHGTERDRIAALDAGADDFVGKPFSMDELRARVDAALRRRGPADTRTRDHPVAQFGEVRIDLAGRQVEVCGEPVRLTPMQWRLLEVLVTREGRLLTYQQIISEVWSPQHGDEARDSLRAHLRTLRHKLDDDASDPRYIATELGVGYRWVGGVASGQP